MEILEVSQLLGEMSHFELKSRFWAWKVLGKYNVKEEMRELGLDMMNQIENKIRLTQILKKLMYLDFD